MQRSYGERIFNSGQSYAAIMALVSGNKQVGWDEKQLLGTIRGSEIAGLGCLEEMNTNTSTINMDIVEAEWLRDTRNIVPGFSPQ